MDGRDAHNKPILTKFRCEDQADYQYRKDITKPRNHLGIIIDRYNGFVFRKDPVRSEEALSYSEFIEAADLSNNDLNTVMSEALKAAQVDGFSILVADTTATPGVKTLAQAKAENARPFIRVVEANSLINWNIIDGYLTEALILYEDAEGKPFARYYNDTKIIDYSYSKASLGGVINEYDHGYGDIPVVMLDPGFPGYSQAAPIAELQQELTTTLSLLKVEQTQSVYTQQAFFGEPPELAEDGRPPAQVGGSSKILYLGQDGKLERIGADVAASDALRRDIDDTEKAIYRISGLASSNPFQVGQPQSGVSKAYDDAQAADVARMLSRATQQAENKIMDLIFVANYNFKPAVAIYDKEFTLNTISSDLERTQQLIGSEVPDVLKSNNIRSMKNRHFSLNGEEEELFNEQLEVLYPSNPQAASSSLEDPVEDIVETP